MEILVHLLHLFAFFHVCTALAISPQDSLNALANLSSTSNSINAPSFITNPSNPLSAPPHTMRIPDTPYSLSLQNIHPGVPMSQFDIGGLLEHSKDDIEDLSRHVGPNAPVPMIYREFSLPISSSEEIFFAVRTEPGHERQLTPAVMEGIFKELQIFMIGGQRYDAVTFEVDSYRFLSRYILATGEVSLRTTRKRRPSVEFS